MNNNDLYTSESVSGKIGQVVRGLKDRLDIEKTWNVSSSNRKYSEKNLPEEDYNRISKAFAGMRKSKTYNEYKKHYSDLCSVTGIPRSHVVIVTYKLNNSKEGNSVEIIYNTAPKKITIPAGATLYHMSTCHTIDALIPQFKGKSAKSYLYSEPRVYFTLKRNMNKFAADIKHNEKITTYTPTEKINSAYIDPLVPAYTLGAVFVETNHPIRVEKVKPETKKNKKNDKDKEVKESVINDFEFDGPAFVCLDEFMEYYGLEYAEDDEIYQEGVIKEKIGQIARKIDGKLHVKKEWDKALDKVNKSSETMNLPEDTKKELKKQYEMASTTDNFSAYKKAHAWICKLFKIPSKDTTIENLHIGGDNEDTTIKFNTNKSRKIVIPADTELVHYSDNDLTEIKPEFRSGSSGKKLYPSKRVYFTIRKRGTSDSSDKKGFVPKENIKTAFINPNSNSFTANSIFVDTSLPIPVKKPESKKVESVKESVIDMLSSYFNESYITESEKEELENVLK